MSQVQTVKIRKSNIVHTTEKAVIIKYKYDSGQTFDKKGNIIYGHHTTEFPLAKSQIISENQNYIEFPEWILEKNKNENSSFRQWSKSTMRYW